jgi:hypothetical protein
MLQDGNEKRSERAADREQRKGLPGDAGEIQTKKDLQQ